MKKESHLSDEEMLLSADGELSTHSAAQVRAHLAECWGCRARMAEIEGTIADFARAHRQAFDPQVPPIAGARAHLRAQLAELASKPPARSWQWLFQFVWPRAAYIGIAFVVAAVAGILLIEHSNLSGRKSGVSSAERGAEPDPRLTPGATRRVTLNDVCSMAHEEVVGQVSTPLRQEVFREYGIVNVRGGDYEVDYLIAPGLGGVEDIRNLWPEPSTSRTWNAYVKDALEEHLHQLVCAGDLDLPTAQRDIAADWIAAYKKYFHTDRPLSLDSHLDPGLHLPPGPFETANTAYSIARTTSQSQTNRSK
jgi:Putative zinc-finger